MFVKKGMFGVLAITLITACGGMEPVDDETTLGISGKGGGGEAVEATEVVMVDEFCGMIEYPSEGYTVGMAENTVASKLLVGGYGIIQVNTNFDLNTYFYSEWHKWEIAIAPKAGSFVPEDPDCRLSGRSNDLQNLLRIWVYGTSGTPSALSDGKCNVDINKDQYINIRPVFTNDNKSCADVRCRFKFTDTAC